MLYSMEVQHDVSVSHARTVMDMFSKPFPQSIVDFSLHLVHGVLAHRQELDDLVREQSYHWNFERIALLDRQIMRIALFELLYESKTPAPVCINEAVDIAKIYSTSESGHFINGILDNIRKNTKKMVDG
jgi:N utilization substance protein B